MIAAAILLPLVGGALLWPLGIRVTPPRRRGVLGAGAISLLAASLAAAVVAAVSDGRLDVVWSSQLSLTFAADGVAGVVAALVPAVAVVVVAYASVHEDVRGLPRLLGLMVAFTGAMQMVVLAADLLALTIGWELVAACSWALIGSAWSSSDAVGKAAHAFNATRVGSIGLILAAGVTFASTGSFAYDAIGDVPRPMLDAVAAGVLLAAMSKSAQLPFSPWLFSAMAGPTSVSALLHSATMVAAGAYALIVLGPSFSTVGWFGPVVTAVGLATALVGGVVALGEVRGKRILAASTAAQYGLMFAAVGMGAPAAAAAHLVAHALLKSQLFLAVGVGMSATGTGDVRRWHLGSRMPTVAVAAAVGALALAAAPPLGAAWTKEQIVAAAVTAGPVPGILAFLAGLLSAVYALRLHLLAFGRDRTRPAPDPDRPDPHRVEVAVIVLLAVASAALGVLWLPGAREVVEGLVGGTIDAGHPWELVLAVVLVLLGAAVAVWAVRREGDVLPHRLADAAAGWFGATTAAQRLVVTPVLASAAVAARFDDAVLDLPPRLVARAAGGLTSVLPRFDDRVVDGAVRTVAAAARAASRGVTRTLELGVDGIVAAIAAATTWIGDISRRGDDRGVDGAVEAIAERIGAAGTQARRLQTGLAHHYYVIAVIGLVVLFGVLLDT
ncbi:proton-conducting transporter membrane subunit [Euzebya rosea]|uniref:proton-conducting transporter transmembrane domain-containing protein n=1 Tax=Euzebya rosea TaxID=2052804 RepID=UPI000D3E06F6|nr:proton-conducting transporter membrane subunit [Euzebya rosea]